MTKAREINLPAGTRTVQVSEIPGLLARAIHPKPDTPPTLAQIIKAPVRANGEREGPIYPLTSDDMALLAEILGPPPQPGEPTTDEKWLAYIEPWFKSPRRPLWIPGRRCENTEDEAAMLRADAQDEHEKALKAAIRDGSFVPLNHALLPLEGWTRELLSIGQVFIQTFTDYAAKFGITVRIEPSPTITPPNSTSSTHKVPKPSLMTKHPPKLNRPDWGFWRHMPEVRLWQAVMLSFNTEPDPDYPDGGYDDFLTETPEASKRLQLLRANLSNREHFSAGTLNLAESSSHGVRLTEFAAWAAEVVQWSNLPPELVAMAQRPEATPIAQQDESFGRMVLRQTKQQAAEEWAMRDSAATPKREASAEPPPNTTGRIQSSGHERTALYDTVGEQTAAVSEIVEEITEKTLLSSLDQWEANQRTCHIENVARGFIERNVLDSLRELVNAGTVIARDPKSDLPLHGPLDYQFACDLNWKISRRDGYALARHVATHPIPSFKVSVTERAHEAEENAEIRAANVAEKNAAGRYTLEEAATLIATNTGERDSDVLALLVSAVKEGKLTVHKPGRGLPYRPKIVSKVYEEAYWNDLNAWLDSFGFRPPWRFPNPGNPKAHSESTAAKHERAILGAIKTLGLNCMALQRGVPGKPGSKAAIKSFLGQLTDKQFENAWQRLTATKAIKYAA